MTEYTPTTEEVRQDFAFPWSEEHRGDKKLRIEAFNRWLAQVKAEAQVEALEDLATAHYLDGPQSTYDTIMRYADRIAREAGIVSEGTTTGENDG